MMITTIIFDLSEVYLKGAMGAGKHLQNKKEGEITDSHLLLSELDQMFAGNMSEDTYWQTVIKKNRWADVSVDELKKAIRNNFTEIKGTRKIIEKLKKNNYKLGLLSNHAKEWVEYCEITYKYHQLFHTVLYSYEAKLSKPNKDIFLLILEKLQAKPQECLFIDDHIKNTYVAKELGMETIHFTSASDLKKRLKELKIRL